MKREQIVKVFTKLGKEELYLWFSGVVGEGEYKRYYNNGEIWQHFIFKNNKMVDIIRQ